ncbi:MAG: HlyD family type I secretion periplasmic adaptor subunit [Pseudomonadota bacterium]
MEPTDKSPVKKDSLVVEFLPDADEIERGPLPRGTRFTLHTLTAALITFIVWASFSQIDRVVVAKGRLVNPTSNIIVQPLETSIIKTIDVSVGQIVKKGQRLASLDPTFTQADEAQLRTRLRSVDTQAKSLQAELNGKHAGYVTPDSDGQLQAQLSAERLANLKAQQTRLNETLAKLASQIESNRKEQIALSGRVRSLREIENMQDKLYQQNFGAKVSLLEAQEKRLEVERELQLSISREQELKRDLGAAEAEKNAFDKGWRQKTMEDLLGASRERDSLAEQLLKADKRSHLINLTAPEDGVVLEIAKLAPGSIVREAETFFTIVPINAKMEAEVQIDSIDVGYIKTGDAAHVKFDAFPFQKHGALDAKVRTISEDAFRRDANGHGLDAFYVAYVDLGASKLKKMGPSTRLLPGMTLQAEIVVGKRSVMSYLMWPLTKALDESIREP